MALFALDELALFLQADIDTAAAALARDLATGLVVDQVGVVEETDTTIILPVEVDDTGRDSVRVPGAVVTAVTAVEVDGTVLTEGDDWEWLRPLPVVRLHRCPSTGSHRVATVTATIGYPTVPAVVKAVALSVAARAYDNPTGLRSESIDDYSVTRAGSDADLAGLTLTDAERAALARLAPAAYVTGSTA